MGSLNLGELYTSFRLRILLSHMELEEDLIIQ